MPESSNKMSSQEVPEPQERIKKLSLAASAVNADDSVPIKRYWRSGKELVKMANVYKEEGNLEKAFVLFMKYITLFVEKIPQHVEYRNADAADKKITKETCKMVFPIAEELKNKLILKYEKEYNKWLKEKERIEAEEAIRLEKDKEQMEEWKQQEEAKRLAEIQEKLDRRIEEAKERINLPVGAAGGPVAEHNFVPPDNNNLLPLNANNRMAPRIDRSTKPLLSFNESEAKMRTVIIPQSLTTKFLQVAEKNTKSNVETCATLSGKLYQDVFTITHVLVPAQNGTANSCVTQDEEKLFEFQDEHELITIGWIHTHPTQNSFMSSIDLHTHCSYQLMLPEAIAIVCAPLKDQTGIYSLSEYGVDFISKCRSVGFHPHPVDPPIYSQANHIEFANSQVQVVDLRV